MGEKRALLDPEMYKISEEDSQDEEVLAGRLNRITDLRLDNHHIWTSHQLAESSSQAILNPFNFPPPPPSFLNSPVLKGSPQPFVVDIQHKDTSLSSKGRVESTVKLPVVQSVPDLPVRALTQNNNVQWPASSDSNSSSEGGASSGEESSGSSGIRPPPRVATRVRPDQVVHERIRHEEPLDYSDSSSSDSCSTCSGGQNHRRRRRNRSHGSYSSSSSATFPGKTQDDELENLTESDYDFDFYSDEDDEDDIILITDAEIEEFTSRDGSLFLYEKVYQSEESSDSHSNRDSNELPLQEAKSSLGKKRRKGITRFLKRSAASSSASVNPKEERKSTTDSSTGLPGNKVLRFKDEDEGEIRHITLTAHPQGRSNMGRRSTLVESLLGITTGRFSSNSSNGLTIVPPGIQARSVKVDSQEDDRVMVAGFIPDGPAVTNRLIKIGDWLQSIDGRPVTLGNIDSVLATVMQMEPGRPRIVTDEGVQTVKIRLTVQRVTGCTINEVSNVTERVESFASYEQPSSTNSIVSKELKTCHLPAKLLANVGVMFICIQPNASIPESERNKDVLFTWPNVPEAKTARWLRATKGLFCTLYPLVRDITGAGATMSKIFFRGKPLDVNYTSDDNGDGVLLLVLPSGLLKSSRFRTSSESEDDSTDSRERTNMAELYDANSSWTSCRIMNRVRSAILYQFGTFDCAFRKTSKATMSRLIYNVLTGIQHLSDEYLFPSVPVPPVQYSRFVQSTLDEMLYQFEAADLMTQGIPIPVGHDNVVPLLCTGTCLMYKGTVLITHMANEIASDFYCWWRTHLANWNQRNNSHLASTFESMRRLILWQPTFSMELSTLVPTPTFSVLVGIGFFYLGFILEPAFSLMPRQVNPDNRWIQKALNFLYKLTQKDLSVHIENRLSSCNQDVIELLPPRNVNNATNTKKYSNDVMKQNKKSASVSASILKNPTETTQLHCVPNSQLQHAGGTMIFSGGSGYFLPSQTDSNIASDAEDEEIEDGGTGSDASSFKWNGGGVTDLSSEDKPTTFRVMKGNVLFDFVQLEYGSGILLQSGGQLQNESYSTILDNFRQTVSITHDILHKAQRARERLRAQEGDKKFISRTLVPICEHGILFQCEVEGIRELNKKKTKTRSVTYWVIGRMYPHQRELYVCYEDGPIPQNLTEVAFKIAQAK